MYQMGESRSKDEKQRVGACVRAYVHNGVRPDPGTNLAARVLIRRGLAALNPVVRESVLGPDNDAAVRIDWILHPGGLPRSDKGLACNRMDCGPATRTGVLAAAALAMSAARLPVPEMRASLGAGARTAPVSNVYGMQRNGKASASERKPRRRLGRWQDVERPSAGAPETRSVKR